MASRTSRVLRIGILQHGQLVQERLVQPGESVTIGESAKSTFVLRSTSLPPELTLFRATEQGYVLQLTDGIRGRLRRGAEVVVLQPGAALLLTEQDQGKLSIGPITVLFQFAAPPVVASPRRPIDFRPRVLEENDAAFLGFLAIWSAMAAVLMIYVANTEPRELTLDALPDRLTRVVIPTKARPLPRDEAPLADPPAEADPQPHAPPEPSLAKGPVEPTHRKVTKAELMENNKLLIALVGTPGESSGRIVDDLWSDRDRGLGSGDALKVASGVTTDAAEASRSWRGGGGDRATIEQLGGIGGGTAALGSGPASKLSFTLGEGELEELVGDASAVSSTVKRNAGQLKYCYESQLKANPALSGRVEIGWTIRGGRATGLLVVSNSTGDPALAECLEQRIKRWDFPPESEGDISWPFVFQPGKG